MLWMWGILRSNNDDDPIIYDCEGIEEHVVVFVYC